MKSFILAILLMNTVVSEAQNIVDNKSYQTELLEYLKGSYETNKLLSLTLKTKEKDNDSLALKIAKDYKIKYLDKNDPRQVFVPEQRNYFAYYFSLFNITDKWFTYFYKNPEEVDFKLHAPNFSNWFTDKVIYERCLVPLMNKYEKAKKQPDWPVIETLVTKKFDAKSAYRGVLTAKVDWYKKIKDWDSYIKFNLEKFDSDGVPMIGVGASVRNDFFFYTVFFHSINTEILTKCISQMEEILKSDPNRHTRIDTYACLLYKIGHKAEAISHEEKALEIAKKNGESSSVKEYTERLEKMQNDLPTWL